MNTRKPVVLVAPLDWGLGHTIRCIPVIRQLLEDGCEVIVACNPNQKQLLTYEFSFITFVSLRGYNIRYGKSRVQTLLRIIFQVPKMLIRIKQEKDWLKAFLRKTRVNAVISDNRYGFFSEVLPCFFITHQLSLKSGLGRFIDRIVQGIIYAAINKFTVCWIPDWENMNNNAGGDLSHPARLPRIPVKYIGCLSRFEDCVSFARQNNLLIILSGPEPQRTQLEKIIVEQLNDYRDPAILVRGIFDSSTLNLSENITVINYAGTTELNRCICDAEIIISRAGYTTIMDLLKLRKKMILVPTPGQTEQEYLGTYLHERKLAYTIEQGRFFLKTALESARAYQTSFITEPMDEYKGAVQEFVKSLKKDSANHHV